MRDLTAGLSPRGAAIVDLWSTSEQLCIKVDTSLGALHGIAFVEFMVLFQLSLSPSGHMRRVDLATAIGRSPSGVTRLLKPLEKIGLVTRASSDRDARVSLVKLTEAGWAKLDDALPTVDQLGGHLTRAVGDSLLDSLSAALCVLKQ